MTGYDERKRRLEASVRTVGDLVVAFSGGVDSSVLLHVAHHALGERAVGWIADSPSLPRRELEQACRQADAMGARLVVAATHELGVEGYRENNGERCYHCRRTLFEGMESWARTAGFRHLAYGEITDDLLGHRPGRRAASELGIVAPLRAADFSKEDVRRYASEAGLESADKPASACLASRLPRGTEVTAARLARIEAAEEGLRLRGYRELRVRDHGARAELEFGPAELERARNELQALSEFANELGFEEIAVLAYRAGGATAVTAPEANTASR